LSRGIKASNAAPPFSTSGGTFLSAELITHFLIGFTRLTTDDNIENAVCAGPGMIVTLGSVHGIVIFIT